MNFLHILLKCHQQKLISSCLNGQYYFERPPTSQNIEYKVLGNSLEEEEYKDPTSTCSSLEEGEGTETPSQPDPIEEPESLPFEIHRPTI